MRKIILIIALTLAAIMLPWLLPAQQPVPPAATQAQVNAGTATFPYVSPATLAGYNTGSNGVTAVVVTNIANTVVSNYFNTVGAVTNGAPGPLTIGGINLNGVNGGLSYYGIGGQPFVVNASGTLVAQGVVSLTPYVGDGENLINLQAQALVGPASAGILSNGWFGVGPSVYLLVSNSVVTLTNLSNGLFATLDGVGGVVSTSLGLKDNYGDYFGYNGSYPGYGYLSGNFTVGGAFVDGTGNLPAANTILTTGSSINAANLTGPLPVQYTKVNIATNSPTTGFNPTATGVVLMNTNATTVVSNLTVNGNYNGTGYFSNSVSKAFALGYMSDSGNGSVQIGGNQYINGMHITANVIGDGGGYFVAGGPNVIYSVYGMRSSLSNAAPVFPVTLSGNVGGVVMWTNSYPCPLMVSYSGGVAVTIGVGALTNAFPSQPGIALCGTSFGQWPEPSTTAGSVPLRMYEVMAITNGTQPTLIQAKMYP